MAETTQITFTIENQLYGIEIMDVRAVEKPEGISPVLGAPGFIKGVLNLRGELIPVYSMRSKFGLPVRPIDDETKLIIVNLDAFSVAIEVDEVGGIARILDTKASDRPMMLNSATTQFVGHVAELDGKIILLVDLKYLMPEDERQAMAEMLELGKES